MLCDNYQIVPANNTLTTQFVFGQERSLFPHPKTRNINQRKSKEINLPATYPVAKKYRNREGEWEKNYTRYKNNVTSSRVIRN